MESLELLGITFRSAQHMHWFVLTCFLFVISTLGFFTTRDNLLIRTLSWHFLFYYHGFFAVASIVATEGGTINGVTWSVDCIWFNSLMAVMYLGLYLLLQKKKKRNPPFAHSKAL